MSTAVSKTASLFLVAALTNQLVKPQIVESNFRRVTRPYDHMYNFKEGGHTVSKVFTAVECVRICLKFEQCSGFTWDPESQDCSVGLVDTHYPAGSVPAIPGHGMFFLRILHCLTSLGYELIYTAGQTPMCVKFQKQRKTKPEAEAVCASLQGSLVRVDTRDKLDKILEFILAYKHELGRDIQYVIVDGSDEADEGSFTWSDGSPLGEDALGLFAPGEPKGGLAQSFIAVSISHQAFLDIGGTERTFVCEMRLL